MLASSPARANTVKMSHGLLRTRCELDSEGRELLRHAMEELHLSARAYDRMLKVARTIADLAESQGIRHPDVRQRSNTGRWTGICGIELRDKNLLCFSSPDPFAYRDSRLTRGHAFAKSVFNRIGASWRKKKSAFVATQTTSRKAPAVTAEMMFLRLTSQRAFFFHHRRLHRVSVSPWVEPVALQ